MATYRIVDTYRKSKAIKGIHYNSWNEQILAYRVDKRHSLLFGLIHYWDYGAYNLCPEYLFPSVDKAKEVILKVDKSKIITILYELLMKAENIKFKAKRLDNNTWVEGYFYAECGNTYIIEDRQSESMLNRNGAHQVDPLTVCQFTGLKDCKGKEIFEHDLIHFVGFSYTAEVIWSEGKYSFMVVCYNKHSYRLHDVIEVCRIERIGNKFDKLRMMLKKKEDMKGTFGEIYKMKIDAYNSYYQQMRLLGKVNETLSFDEWEKKHCKWLK